MGVSETQQQPTRAGAPARRPDQHDLFRSQFSKTKLCKFYAMRQCRYGDECEFAHGQTDLGSIPDLKKTAICNKWRHGSCPLKSSECPFAHGRNELRLTAAYAKRANEVFAKARDMTNSPHEEELNIMGKYSSAGNIKMESKTHVNELYQFKTMLNKMTQDSSTEVATTDEICSVSSRSRSGSVPATEPSKVATDELLCCGGPSALVCNMPYQYTKSMLVAEIKDLGFDIPRDIAYINFPATGDTLKPGQCFIAFAGRNPLKAFIEVFQGRVLRHFKAQQKSIVVVQDSSLAGVGAAGGPTAALGRAGGVPIGDMMQAMKLPEGETDMLAWPGLAPPGRSQWDMAMGTVRL